MSIDPSFIAPGPARAMTCTRCGATVAEEAATMARHVAWHRDPALVEDRPSPDELPPAEPR
jgi:hypothetical protein